jgi:hypothetical protein
VRFVGHALLGLACLGLGEKAVAEAAWASWAQAEGVTALSGRLWRRSQTAASIVWAIKTGGVSAARGRIQPALAAMLTGAADDDDSAALVASHKTRSYSTVGGT